MLGFLNCCGTIVTEVITTALHEICHHVLGEKYPKMKTGEQHYYIYKVQIEVQMKLGKWQIIHTL